MLRLTALKRLTTLLSICTMPFVLAHCASQKQVPFPAAPTDRGTAVVNTSKVTRVVLSGHMHINLNTRLHRQHLTFKLPLGQSADRDVQIIGHTLYINNTHDSNMPNHFNLTIGKHLNVLSLHGNVSVDAQKLDTKQLTIIDASGGRVNLNGRIDVQRIYASQHSHLNITWVDSPVLVLYGNDHAHVNLAGNTKEFFIHLTGSAELDAQYLRAGAVTISSNAYSQSHLMPLNSFQGFAHQGSTVYLYHHPKHMNSHTWGAGNIFMQSYRP